MLSAWHLNAYRIHLPTESECYICLVFRHLLCFLRDSALLTKNSEHTCDVKGERTGACAVYVSNPQTFQLTYSPIALLALFLYGGHLKNQ